MTDEAINRAIAEITLGSWYSRELPDYCRDLNEIHDAVTLRLNVEQQQRFAWRLYELLRPGQLICLADARQRAEAFLRTVGKWEETALDKRKPLG
jgi:hypothetical protein